MSGPENTPSGKKPSFLSRLCSFLWRWTKRLTVALVIVLVLARIALPYVLPKLLANYGEQHELELGYQDLDVSLHRGEVTLSRLVARPVPGEGEEPAALLRLDYLTLDIDMSALLTGDVKIHRVELDGVRADLERFADGSWNFERHFKTQPSESEPAEEKTADAPSTADEPLSLELPLELTALLVQDVRLHLVDRTIEPALDTVFEFDLRLADLGSLVHPAKLRASLRSREVLEVLRIEAEAVPAPGGALSAELDLHLAGMHAEPLRGLLGPAGLRPVARSVDASLRARLIGIPEAQKDENGVRGLRLAAEVSGLQVSADGQEALGLDSLILHAPHLSSRRTEISDASLRGLRARAATNAAGHLLVSGFELVPVPAAESETEPKVAAAEPEELPPAQLSLARLSIGDVALSFFEGGKEVPFEFLLPRLTVDDLLIDPAADPERSMRVALDAAAPGLMESIKLRATATPFAPERTVKLDLDAAGIVPERAAPYLEAAGIRSELEDGRLRLEIEGGLRVEDSGSGDSGALQARARLRNFSFTDGEKELFGWNELRLVDFYHSAPENLTRVGELEIGGPRLVAKRDAEGVLHAFGLSIRAPRAGATSSSETGEAAPASSSEAEAGAAAKSTPPAEEDAESVPARFELGRFGWTESSLAWSDESLLEPLDLSFEDFGLVLENLTLGGEESGAAAKRTADLQLWFSEPKLARDLRLSGHIDSTPGPLDVQVELLLAGQGLTTQAIEPYLREAGVETLFDEASLSVAVDADVRARGEDMEVEAALTDLRFDAAERTWLSFDALRVSELRVLGDGGLEAKEIALVGPRAEAERDDEGRLVVMGMRLPAPEAAAANEAGAASRTTAPGDSSAPATRSSATSSTTSPGSSGTSSRIAIDSIRLDGLEAAWRDRAVAPQVETALRVNGVIQGLVLGGESASEARFDLTTALDGALESLQLSGGFTLDGDDVLASLQLEGDGLRAGPLASYLPENLEVLLESGRLASHVEASFTTAREGGRALAVEITETSYSEAERPPFIALDRLTLSAPRIDAESLRYDIAELTTSGFRAEAKKTSEGLELLGLRLRPATSLESEPAEPTTTEQPPQEPASAPRNSPTLAAVSTDLSALPTITLGRLDLGIDSFRFVDESETSVSAVPLEATLHLSTREPLTLLAPDPEDLPPMSLDLELGLDPIVREATVELTVAPWIPSAPTAQVKTIIRGIRGEGLTEVLPELAEVLDGSGLDDGRLDMNMTLTLKKRRRSPLDFDLAREGGFGLEVEMEGPLLRDREDGEPVLGLGGAFVDVQRIRPDSGDMHIRLLELSDPVALVHKEAEGMRIAGLLLKAAQNPEAEADETVVEKAAELEAQLPEEVAVEAAAERAPELRIDKLLVNGARLEFRDQTVSPEMVLPLEGLEVEVKRFTTRAFEEPRTFSYRVTAYGGKATLPEHYSGNLVGGLLATAANLVGAGSKREMEERTIFDQVSTQGRLTLYPHLKGHTKVDLAGLELLAFRGAAQDAGIDLRDGVTDAQIDLRFRGERGLSINSETVFSLLSVTEPIGGPIQTFLRLPAPLDTVIFVLGNEEGEVVVPLDLRFASEGVSLTQLTTQITLTLTNVITKAIAGSPLRIVGGVLDLAGLGAEEPLELNAADTVQLGFSQGVVNVSPEAWAAVSPLVQMMRRDGTIRLTVAHAFSESDREHAARLANPSSEEARQLTRRLRARKQDLIADRDELALQARSLLAVGRSKEAAETAARVRAIDTDLSVTETALDEILELLRPGAEHRADRRARRFGIELANLRLADVRRRLEALPVRSIADRITVRRPRWDEEVEADGTKSGGRVTIVPKN